MRKLICLAVGGFLLAACGSETSSADDLTPGPASSSTQPAPEQSVDEARDVDCDEFGLVIARSTSLNMLKTGLEDSVRFAAIRVGAEGFSTDLAGLEFNENQEARREFARLQASIDNLLENLDDYQYDGSPAAQPIIEMSAETVVLNVEVVQNACSDDA